MCLSFYLVRRENISCILYWFLFFFCERSALEDVNEHTFDFLLLLLSAI